MGQPERLGRAELTQQLRRTTHRRKRSEQCREQSVLDAQPLLEQCASPIAVAALASLEIIGGTVDLVIDDRRVVILGGAWMSDDRGRVRPLQTVILQVECLQCSEATDNG